MPFSRTYRFTYVSLSGATQIVEVEADTPLRAMAQANEKIAFPDDEPGRWMEYDKPDGYAGGYRWAHKDWGLTPFYG
jgi:hypothetical protein